MREVGELKTHFERLIKEERGNALVLTALSLVFLLVMTGLALDGGYLYMTKSKLQKAANAAVLSGAQELTNSEEKVDEVVQNILANHDESGSLDGVISVQMNDRVAINLKKSVKLNFLQVLGFDKVDVKVHAAAGLAPLGRAAGAAPLGISQDTPLELYKEYQLKVDSSGVSSGNFGILALGGPGARTYEQNLLYGYQEEIKIGDIIDTQTGNIAGDTRDAIQQRINSCSAEEGDYEERDCSRILLIPVYAAYDYDQNQVKSVKVIGFAYFYITQPMSSTDTAVSGMFIKRAGTGFYQEGSLDDGAYSIRLTE